MERNCNSKFLVRTDHQSLAWEAGLKETLARLTRWKARLAPYALAVRYLKGVENGLADCLSRNVGTLEVNAGEEEVGAWNPDEFNLELLDSPPADSGQSWTSPETVEREELHEIQRRSIEW